MPAPLPRCTPRRRFFFSIRIEGGQSSFEVFAALAKGLAEALERFAPGEVEGFQQRLHVASRLGQPGAGPAEQVGIVGFHGLAKVRVLEELGVGFALLCVFRHEARPALWIDGGAKDCVRELVPAPDAPGLLPAALMLLLRAAFFVPPFIVCFFPL